MTRYARNQSDLNREETEALAQTQKLAAADERAPRAPVENLPTPNQPGLPVMKQAPLTPAQAEYKRVYPNTVYPPVEVPPRPGFPNDRRPSDPLAAVPPSAYPDTTLGRLKAQVDEALAASDLRPAVRRKLDEIFETAKEK